MIIDMDRDTPLEAVHVSAMTDEGHTDSGYVARPEDLRHFAPRLIGHAHSDASLMMVQATDAGEV